MSKVDWTAVHTAVARAATPGRPVRVWLRDDDAMAATPALDRLGDLCGAAGLPILLAVIPAGVTDGLASWLADRPFVTACQHGYAHRNHAGAGERACELGGERRDEAVLDDLRAGRARLQACLRRTPAAILVPPWNRIRESLLPRLPDEGFAALSTFAGQTPAAPAPLPRLDCDLDIIDWRNGRRGRPLEDLCARLLPLIARAKETGRPIGLLTHHLAHDEAAWAFLDAFLRAAREDPNVVFTDADTELRRLREAHSGVAIQGD